MGAILRFGNSWLAWGGKLLSMPDSLYAYLVNAFSNGWDRNRAIDITGGANNNALMGGYLLAASNTAISIPGIRVTNQDTIVALTPNGLVGKVAVAGTMTFVAGQSYGAFEVYRSGARIGRYCLTERQGTMLINQITGAGALPNGLIRGTTTTVWQRSNAFYCETNHNGYSIAGTGWVTNNGEALVVGAIIPADLANHTKCLAWVGGVQQDLQYAGRAKNSVSVVPYTAYCNADRSWNGVSFSGTITSHYISFKGIINGVSGVAYPYGTSGASLSDTRNRSIYVSTSGIGIRYPNYTLSVSLDKYISRPIHIEGGFDGATNYMYIKVTDLLTGAVEYVARYDMPSSLTLTVMTSRWGVQLYGYESEVREDINGVTVLHAVFDQHSSNFINLKTKATHVIVGVSTSLHQNVDIVHNVYNQTGYELWTNGTDYQIYPLASDGTRFITPAGYTIVETVTAGNMPSVADSRFTTFKYALANSCVLRNSVPEAYNADAQATPKLLTYAELSALSSNIKVTKTEANGKITTIKIKQ